jgi:ketosteroid isomerase-like protein
MSQENVEVFRHGVEAWNRRDLDGLFGEVWDPEIEFDFSRYEGWPEARTLRGEAEVRAFLEQWRDTFSDYRFEVERYVHAGSRVLALCSQRGAGRDSSGVAMMNFAQIATVKDGRIVRLENYSNRNEALEAVGLSE